MAANRKQPNPKFLIGQSVYVLADEVSARMNIWRMTIVQIYPNRFSYSYGLRDGDILNPISFSEDCLGTFAEWRERQLNRAGMVNDPDRIKALASTTESS